jgi:cell division protein FtsL
MGIEIEQIRNIFKKTLQNLAEKSFWASIFLIFFAILIGCILFYKYDFLASKNEPQPTEVSIKIKTEIYSDILTEWESRQAKFEAADFKNWSDPFFPPGLTKSGK